MFVKLANRSIWANLNTLDCIAVEPHKDRKQDFNLVALFRNSRYVIATSTNRDDLLNQAVELTSAITRHLEAH